VQALYAKCMIVIYVADGCDVDEFVGGRYIYRKGGRGRAMFAHTAITLEHNDVSFITCDSGYRPSTTASSTCQRGRWIPRLPHCIEGMYNKIIHGIYYIYTRTRVSRGLDKNSSAPDHSF
jgi:hypothetical protein